MLRIIAGEYRSRLLTTPEGTDRTRPMGSRTREAVFNLLRGWFENAVVVDLFAGVGTMGLEAISRGAARVLLVEKDREVFRLLQENIAKLGCGDAAIALMADALSETALAASPRPVDVVFCDPPFELVREPRDCRRLWQQLARLRTLFGDKGFLVLRLPEERAGEEGRIAGFAGPEIHRYGEEQWLHLYAPIAAPKDGAAALPATLSDP